MIALKGAIREFYNPLTALQTVSNTYAQGPGEIMCNTSSTYHVQHAVCHLVRRDSSAIKFDRVEITFTLA